MENTSTKPSTMAKIGDALYNVAAFVTPYVAAYDAGMIFLDIGHGDYSSAAWHAGWAVLLGLWTIRDAIRDGRWDNGGNGA